MADTDNKKEGIVGIYLGLRNALARSVTGIVPPKDVEDIVQETYVRVCQIEQKEEIKTPRSYLFKIARNLALDYKKRADNQLNDSMDAMEEEQQERHLYKAEQLADSVYEQAASNEEFALFCEAVRHLPVQCRRVFVLRKVYGYSQRDIARQMNVTESTVEKHIAKGMKRCLFYMQQNNQMQQNNKPAANDAGHKRDGVNKNAQAVASAMAESPIAGRQQSAGRQQDVGAALASNRLNRDTPKTDERSE